MTLASAVYLITTDPEFEARFRAAPEEALSDKGILLSEVDLEILKDMQAPKNSHLLQYGDGPILPQYEWALTQLQKSSI
jgi:hypothetical protein